MIANISVNNALAKISEGIVCLAGQRNPADIEGFFAALNSLTGQNIRYPHDEQHEDIFSAYRSFTEEKAQPVVRPVLEGLEHIASGSVGEGIALVVEGANSIRDLSVKSNLGHALMLLDESVRDEKVRKRVKNALWNLKKVKEGGLIKFIPQIVERCYGRMPNFSRLERLYVRFKKEEPETAAPAARKIKISPAPIALSEKEKLKIVLAASIDHLSFLYDFFGFAENGNFWNELVLGVSSYVSPRQKIEFDCTYHDRFKILDAYGFSEDEKKKMDKILGAEKSHGTLEKVAARRMPHFQRVAKPFVVSLADSLSSGGRIFVPNSILGSLRIYDHATSFQLSELREMNQYRQKIGGYSDEDLMRFNLLRESESAAMRELEPGIYNSIPCIGIPEVFAARNWVSALNEFARTFCKGAEEAISCDEAVKFLLNYFESARPPFKEESMIKFARV